MMYLPFEPWGCNRCSTASWNVTLTTTPTTTAAYQNFYCRCNEWTTVSTWPAPKIELPKCEHDSIIQMRRIRLFGGRRTHPRPRAQCWYGRSIAAPLPRQKIKRWRSLKEKRQAWGFA